jgi:hypothetical protein
MMDGSIDTVEPEEGDFFEGVLLETCRDFRVTRPRVRPMGAWRMPSQTRSSPARYVRLSLDLAAAKRRIVKPGSSASPAFVAAQASSWAPSKPKAAAK